MSAGVIAGAALKVASGIFQGITNYNASKQNARMLNAQADQVIEEAKYNEDMTRRDYSRLDGQNRVAIGGSGLTTDSFEDVLHDSDLEFERDIMSQRHQTDKTVSQLRSQAKKVKRAGKLGIVSSIIGGGGDAVGAAGKAGMF